MHKVPELDINIDWITIDYAAASTIDIILQTAFLLVDHKCNIFHVVSTHIIHWSKILDAMRSSDVTFETVPLVNWIEALSRDESNPAFSLTSVYESSFKQLSQMPIWKTEMTIEVASISEKVPVLDDKLFSKFLSYWGSADFCNASVPSKPSSAFHCR